VVVVVAAAARVESTVKTLEMYLLMALHIWQTIRVELLRYVLLRLWIWNMLACLKLLSARLKLVRLILLIMLRHIVLLRGEMLLTEVAHVRRVARLAGMARLGVTMPWLKRRRSCICVRCRAHSSLVHWPDSTDTLAHRGLVILIRLKRLSWIRHSVDHPWLEIMLLHVHKLGQQQDECDKIDSCNFTYENIEDNLQL